MRETRESDEELRGRAIEAYKRSHHASDEEWAQRALDHYYSRAYTIATATGAALDEIAGVYDTARRTVQREPEAGRAATGCPACGSGEGVRCPMTCPRVVALLPKPGEVWRWSKTNTKIAISDSPPSGGVVAWARDSDGHIFGLLEAEFEAGEWTRVSEAPKREPGPCERAVMGPKPATGGVTLVPFATAMANIHEMFAQVGDALFGAPPGRIRAANRSLCHDLARWDNAPAWARGYETVRQARREVVAPSWVRYLARAVESANCQAVPVRLSRASLLEVCERDCEVGRG